MNRLVVLGLVGLLATSTINAQNTQVQQLKPAAVFQLQEDTEFLDLYKDISWLEEILSKN
jgi:hypothetical protein